MDFDDKGRMWVVEMRGFMPHLQGIGDNAPIGKITIQEDRDKDRYAARTNGFELFRTTCAP